MMKFIFLLALAVYFIGIAYCADYCSYNMEYDFFNSEIPSLCTTNTPDCDKIGFLTPKNTYLSCTQYRSSIKMNYRMYKTKKYLDPKKTLKEKQCVNGKATCSLEGKYTHPKIKLKKFEIFLVECFQENENKSIFQEIVDITQPRMTFNHVYRIDTTHTVTKIPPSYKVICESQCVGTRNDIQISVNPADEGLCSKYECLLGINKNKMSKIITVTCKNKQYSITHQFKAMYTFPVYLIDEYGTKRGENNFEYRDKIKCKTNQVSDGLNFNEFMYIAYRYKKNRIMHFADTSSIRDRSKEAYFRGEWNVIYECYFGQKHNNRTVVKSGTLRFLSTKLTKVIDMKTLQIHYKPKFIPGTTIKCDRNYYNEDAKLLIAHVNNIQYPLAHFQSFPGYTGYHYNEYTVVSDIKTKKRLMSCYYNNTYSNPMIMEVTDKLTADIIIIFPPWSTNVIYKDSVLVCVSINKDIRINFYCHANCDGNPFGLASQRMNKSQGQYTFSKTFIVVINKVQPKYFLACGINNKLHMSYARFYVTISRQMDLDPEKLIIMPGDYALCTLVYSRKEDPNVPLYLPIPTVVDQNSSSQNLYFTGYTKRGIKLPKLTRNEAVRYYINLKVSVFESYKYPPDDVNTQYLYYRRFPKEFYVARDFRVIYSPSLNNLFPGNKVRCYVCANFTYHVQGKPCTGKNKLKSKIIMKVKKPNGQYINTRLVTEVTLPTSEFRPDKTTKYDINDYEIALGCLARNKNVATSIIDIKSCETNPPLVVVKPLKKVLFRIGDSVLCTTLGKKCTGGLNFTVIVRKENQVVGKSNKPFRFTQKHAGNNIIVECTSGNSLRSSDSRRIRVEVAPFNISIKPNKRIASSGEYYGCEANGFPKPTYSWRQLTGRSKLRISESFVLITAYDHEGLYEFQCTANNKLQSVSMDFKFKIFNPLIRNIHYSPRFYFIIPLFTLIYLVLLVFAVILVFQEQALNTPLFSNFVITTTISK